jgi:hypothetical protein
MRRNGEMKKWRGREREIVDRSRLFIYNADRGANGPDMNIDIINGGR